MNLFDRLFKICQESPRRCIKSYSHMVGNNCKFSLHRYNGRLDCVYSCVCVHAGVRKIGVICSWGPVWNGCHSPVTRFSREHGRHRRWYACTCLTTRTCIRTIRMPSRYRACQIFPPGMTSMAGCQKWTKKKIKRSVFRGKSNRKIPGFSGNF